MTIHAFEFVKNINGTHTHTHSPVHSKRPFSLTFTHSTLSHCHSQDRQDDKHKVRAYNDVVDKTGKYFPLFSSKQIVGGNVWAALRSFSLFFSVATKSSDCKPQQITAIGNRLLDWFSVIMADSRKQKQHLPKSKSNFKIIVFWSI